MKLVDILARELDRWPEGMSEVVGQGHKGYLHGYAGNGHPNFQATRQIFTMCDDYETEKVTRTQWHDAVDALEAGEVVYSDENVNVHADYVTHTSSPINDECKIVQPEWNGEGLPPVGVDALLAKEFKFTEGTRLDSFPAETVVYVGGHANFGGCDLAVIIIKGRNFCGTIIPELLNPIRTPEQIAADERDRTIGEIREIWNFAASSGADPFIALYAAGYRKFEIVDN